ARMQQALELLGQAVMDYPATNLAINIIYHPRSKAYHLEAKLKLPHITLFTSDWDAYMDSAYQRCVSKLINKVAVNQEKPNGRLDETAETETTLGRDILAPQEPAGGGLGEAVFPGGYAAALMGGSRLGARMWKKG